MTGALGTCPSEYDTVHVAFNVGSLARDTERDTIMPEGHEENGIPDEPATMRPAVEFTETVALQVESRYVTLVSQRSPPT
jgi:hypothetical protein